MKLTIGSSFRYDEKVAPEIYEEILSRAMVNIQNKAKIKAPMDTSELANKIQLKIISPNNILVMSLAPYSSAMEYGTVPFYAPIQPLKEWAQRKLGDEDLGYAIQKKIAKEGINAHPFMRPALDETIHQDLDKISRIVKQKYS